MSIRTTRSEETFTAPFQLSGIEGFLPAGKYAVDHDDELIEGLSWLAYKRVGTLLTLPALGSGGGISQLIDIDPSELQAALEKDRAHADINRLRAALPDDYTPADTKAARNHRNDTDGMRRRATQTAEDNRLL